MIASILKINRIKGVTSLLILLIISALNNIYSQKKSTIALLEETLCEFVTNNEGYYYESFYSYIRRIDSITNQEDYIKNRLPLLPEERIVYLEPCFSIHKSIKPENFNNFWNDSMDIPKDIFLDLIEKFPLMFKMSKELDLDKLKPNCEWKFMKLPYAGYKVYDGLYFHLSPVIYSSDNKWACFYMYGGKGGGPADWLIFANKGDKKWNIAVVRTVNIY